MAQPLIQTSFHAGEWAPALNARVDLSKYHAAAALMTNFFVDYRGGASTRMGTKYILQAYKSSTAVRLIPFQASQLVGYELEFGDYYIRFYNNGAPVLETAFNITSASKANPCLLAVTSHNFNVGDWIYLENIGGMTQLNNRYVKVVSIGGGFIAIAKILDGVNINSTAYSTYTSGGTAKRVYTLTTPYAATDLALLKFAQNVDFMVLCHPSYVPYTLRLISAASWTLTSISFGSSIAVPTGQAVATTLAAGNVNYAYVVTAVDSNEQESGPSAFAALASRTDLRTTVGTNTITWNAVSGAIRYNVYKAELSYAGAVPSGSAFGFIGFTNSTSLIDSNLAPDYSETPPIARNPFLGGSLASVTVTAAGTYTTVPTVTIAAPSSGVQATANAVLGVIGTPTVNVAGAGVTVGASITFTNGVVLVVATVSGGGVASFQPMGYPGSNPGSVTSGSTPTNPQLMSPAVQGAIVDVRANFTWGVRAVTLSNAGAGYTSAPAVTFSAGAAAATAVLGPASNGNPSVPQFDNQRLTLAGPLGSPQQFNMSKPGSYYNFDVSNPVQPDDAIQGTLVSGILNEIRSMISMQSGLIVLTNKSAWQIYGSQPGVAPSAVDITAKAQAYNGASHVIPIVANNDILYVQSKGNSVRNLSYSFYTNVFTGTDISVLSSHLFYGYEISEWAWAEEPFKIVWAVRDDGVMLSLTFLKEQELIGWTHHETQGTFKSVSSITEDTASNGYVDAVYMVVERTIDGNVVKFIERMADRFLSSYTNPWCVDAGLSYSGAPATTFTGAEHLVGKTIVGLADGVPFTAVVSADGSFTLATAASVVIAGLKFTPQLQTLAIDTGNPTIQGKMKAIPSVTVRVQQTLGLKIGSSFTTLVAMKDLVLGNVGSASNATVTGLVTGDAMTKLDATYTVQGQYCIEQPLPYPATILGVIPEITIGDTSK